MALPYRDVHFGSRLRIHLEYPRPRRLSKGNPGLPEKGLARIFGAHNLLFPFCCILAYFSFIYAYDAWRINEISASLVGLPHRWAIKSFLFMGVIVAIIAGLAVWLQIVLALFGDRNKRFPLMTIEWPENTGTMVEGKERLDLEKADDLIEVRARQREEKENLS